MTFEQLFLGIFGLFDKAVQWFFDIIDNRKIIRRFVFIWVLWMTERTIIWSLAFAQNSPRPATEIALIIGTVFVPLNLLLGYVWKGYDSSRQNDDVVSAGNVPVK